MAGRNVKQNKIARHRYRIFPNSDRTIRRCIIAAIKFPILFVENSRSLRVKQTVESVGVALYGPQGIPYMGAGRQIGQSILFAKLYTARTTGFFRNEK